MAKTKDQSLGLPDNVVTLLADAEKKNGLPQGTMQAILQQEVGGNAGKYLSDPAAYHYGLNAEGKRIAGHTGKVSTAFGPFGILESTAKDPGFGVVPLRDKSLAEQIRFSSEYLAARSKKGGLGAGLAGYGEGTKYGQQVAARIGGKGAAPVAASGAGLPEWDAFTQAMPTPNMASALGSYAAPAVQQQVASQASLANALAALGPMSEEDMADFMASIGRG